MRRPIELLAFGVLALILTGSALAEAVQTYTIADSTGDWGYPAPFTHYARGPGYLRMSLVFDTLIWKDDTGFIPALADNWSFIKDENAYIFDLKKGVKWQDGEMLTAKDVAFTFDYLKAHPYQWMDTTPVGRIEVVGDSQIKIYLNKSYAPFLSNIAGTVPILPEHVYRDVSKPESFQDKAAVTGSGPYKLMDYDKAQGTYLYKANEDYYQGSPKVEEIKFVKVSNEMAGAALKKGDVDAASIPADLSKEIAGDGFTVLKGAHDWVAMLMINHKKVPFSDVRFRQALAYAIDRQALVDTALHGYGLAGSQGLYASDSEWYNPGIEQYAHDTSKAEALLKDMGYSKDGEYFTKDGKPLEVEMLMTSSVEGQAEMIKSMLQSLGIKVDLRSVDQKTLDSSVGDWKFDLAISGHGGMGGDPVQLTSSIIGKGFNSARYENDTELSGLLMKQGSEMDADARKKMVDSIQELCSKDVPGVALYYTESFWASNDNVKYYFTPGGVGSGVPSTLNKMVFVK